MSSLPDKSPRCECWIGVRLQTDPSELCCDVEWSEGFPIKMCEDSQQSFFFFCGWRKRKNFEGVGISTNVRLPNVEQKVIEKMLEFPYETELWGINHS